MITRIIIESLKELIRNSNFADSIIYEKDKSERLYKEWYGMLFNSTTIRNNLQKKQDDISIDIEGFILIQNIGAFYRRFIRIHPDIFDNPSLECNLYIIYKKFIKSYSTDIDSISTRIN